MFRKMLVKIRKGYNTNPRNLFLWAFLALGLSTGVGIVADVFLPFVMWGNAIRSVILIPTAASIFVLGYTVSLFMHYARVKGDPNWVPYRLRFSPTWRRRIALIFAALLAVAMYANGFKTGYTFIASIIAAIAVSLFAFIRTTKDEAKREELELPDSRDVKYEQRMKKLEKERLEKEAEKRAEQKARREKFLHGDKP